MQRRMARLGAADVCNGVRKNGAAMHDGDCRGARSMIIEKDDESNEERRSPIDVASESLDAKGLQVNPLRQNIVEMTGARALP
mmetsp:Transcript_49454/g.159157  ORF Transcript_49454/g.159157 Transcript_49454/m.159157 type:complete len:83 (+) Transcript_49454:1616-1864(+)